MKIYRVSYLIADLGLNGFGFECSTVCQILPGMMESWQKGLGKWARCRNMEIQVNPTQVRHQRGHPVKRARKRLVGGLENFLPALASLYCLALPGSC